MKYINTIRCRSRILLLCSVTLRIVYHNLMIELRIIYSTDFHYL